MQLSVLVEAVTRMTAQWLLQTMYVLIIEAAIILYTICCTAHGGRQVNYTPNVSLAPLVPYACCKTRSQAGTV